MRNWNNILPALLNSIWVILHTCLCSSKSYLKRGSKFTINSSLQYINRFSSSKKQRQIVKITCLCRSSLLKIEMWQKDGSCSSWQQFVSNSFFSSDSAEVPLSRPPPYVCRGRLMPPYYCLLNLPALGYEKYLCSGLISLLKINCDGRRFL